MGLRSALVYNIFDLRTGPDPNRPTPALSLIGARHSPLVTETALTPLKIHSGRKTAPNCLKGSDEIAAAAATAQGTGFLSADEVLEALSFILTLKCADQLQLGIGHIKMEKCVVPNRYPNQFCPFQQLSHPTEQVNLRSAKCVQFTHERKSAMPPACKLGKFTSPVSRCSGFANISSCLPPSRHFEVPFHRTPAITPGLR